MMRNVATVLLLLVFSYAPGADGTEQQQQYTHTTVMDLSYKPHVKADKICSAIVDGIITSNSGNDKRGRGRERASSSPPGSAVVELDVSFSELGNEGMVSVIETLLNTTRSIQQQQQLGQQLVTVILSSRMNRLTPEGVTVLLQSILGNDDDDDRINTNVVDDESSECVDNSQSSSLSSSSCIVQSLDLGWNNLSPDNQATAAGSSSSKEFTSMLRKLIESDKCPHVLRLHRCGLGPAACRAIGKGLMNRAKSSPPLILHLCGNDAIGDAGTAALAAAAIKSRSSSSKRSDSMGVLPKPLLLKELDLSSCNVGDAGAEALALGLLLQAGGVRRLDVSNNKISNDGASAIGQSLIESTAAASGRCRCESIDLSNNNDIGDSGAADIARALELGTVRTMSLRSSGIHADGAKAFGTMLVGLSKRNERDSRTLDLDLSGNPIGILRGKSKKEGAKYSASNIKSKASATTASYMNFIGRKIRSGMKEVGLDVGSIVTSVDSDVDDEEDKVGDEYDSSSQGKHPDASRARCGAKAFASAIVVGDQEEDTGVKECSIRCNLGLRHCFLDRGGADALAAAVLQARRRLGVDLVVDANMNPVLEEDMIEALRGDNPATLEEMAERHMNVLETLRVAEERAAEAARRREEDEWGDEYDELDFDRPTEDEYDSDARYDDDYDDVDF